MSPSTTGTKHHSQFLRLELPDEPAPELAEFEVGGLGGDRPTRKDLLGVKRYANALAKFVVHPDTEPLVIGIHGPWGKGKSSFMEFIRDALEEKEKEKQERKKRDKNPDVVSIWFNAWRFQDARQIWAGLASVITASLEKELSPGARLRLRLEHAWSKNSSEVLTLGVSLLVAVLLGLILVLSPEWVRSLPWLEGLLKLDETLALTLGGGAGVLILLWRIPRLLQPVSQRVLEYGRLPNYREQMGYQHRVLADIQRVYTALSKGDDRRLRVVVFIDDLDRCSQKKIIDILQATNLILGESKFFVFLGVSSDMLQAAIRQHYSRDGKPLDRDFARDYLEKIIQLSFRLPQQKPQEQEPLIANLFSEGAREKYEKSRERDNGERPPSTPPPKPEEPVHKTFTVDADGVCDPTRGIGAGATVTVQDTEHELRAFLDLHRFLGDNPRVKKQVINVHRLVKILLQDPGVTWSEDRQKQLVNWLIFCRCWPRRAQELLDNAEKYRNQDDCLAAWRCVDAQKTPEENSVEDFIASAKPPLPGDELGEDGFLRRAMEISRMAQIDE